jgi:hypothetical protein
MKTRSGFVSNSSSTSFCILGFVADKETVNKVEAAYKELKGTGIETQYGIDTYYEETLVGIPVTTMGDNETPLQLKQRLVNGLKTIGVEITLDKIDFCLDGGRDS